MPWNLVGREVTDRGRLVGKPGGLQTRLRKINHHRKRAKARLRRIVCLHTVVRMAAMVAHLFFSGLHADFSAPYAVRRRTSASPIRIIIAATSRYGSIETRRSSIARPVTTSLGV